MWGISYWILPLFAAIIWLAMLLTLFVTWKTSGSPRYPSMDQSQRIAYISDVGAQGLKPVFIAMSATTVVFLDLAFILERWLRHRGRLAQNTSATQKTLSFLSIICALAGAAGLILLTVFDTLRHNRLHNTFLAIFIAGYILSAVFICWQYQRLGKHFRQHRILRASFWIKLAFIIIEVALAIAFGVSQRQKMYDRGAVLEWIIALIFTFYVLSFFVDFIPAVRTKHHQSRETEVEMAYAESQQVLQHPGSTTAQLYGNTSIAVGGYGNGQTDGAARYSHTNGIRDHNNGIANGRTGILGDTYYPDGHSNEVPKPTNVPASGNF